MIQLVIKHSKFETAKIPGDKTVQILPDIATCSDCIQDIFDKTNRRYLYPFTNCTNCGPRFTIIESLPYDRINTTMKNFIMCQDCRQEYENPLNRRFHAQPNACTDCGPYLELWDKDENILSTRHDALLATVTAIKNGKIVAIKGIGGFHLVVDARNEEAVVRLRLQKNREEKPFALMFPSVESIKNECDISDLEKHYLCSPHSPILLLHRKTSGGSSFIGNSVAPNNPYLGVMLPYTPLHHILMKELGIPVVATSGNLSDETICIDNHEALNRLAKIADLFLVHNRPIVRHADDSIARVVMDRKMILRRARGYAPLPITLENLSTPVLAFGGHLKNSVAICSNNNVFISQHIGDLETGETTKTFHQVIEDFQQMYEIKPQILACDLHPEYLSTKHAQKQEIQQSIPLVRVQHHFAHVVSCMAENDLDGSVLGVSWDGTGYGSDNTIWGGEFLISTTKSFIRAAHIRTFCLPGGEKAIKEPRRTALGLLYEIFGDEVFDMDHLIPIQMFSAAELTIMRKMFVKAINVPRTSSVGRLFDAIASIVGLRQNIKFEGQAAMELEFAIRKDQSTNKKYEFRIQRSGSSSKNMDNYSSPLIIDWEPMIKDILDDLKQKAPIEHISTKFHNTLINFIITIVNKFKEKQIVLSGGCFQNKYLLENTILQLRAMNMSPYWHQRIPPNDGGIALGQAVVAANHFKSIRNKLF